MKGTLIGITGGLCLISATAWAQAQQGDSPFDQQPETRLACSKLQTQIEQTIRANGARHFLLEIVDNAQVEGGVVRAGEPHAGAEVVGSCDGGTRKIVYSRHGATESSAPAAASTPEAPDAAGSGAAGAEPSQAEPSTATTGDTAGETSTAEATGRAGSQPEAPTDEMGNASNSATSDSAQSEGATSESAQSEGATSDSAAAAENRPTDDLGRQGEDGRVRDTLKPATSP
ncbi:DUF1161 domain-containing protein [Salinicola sp. JS01]|uniref:DUF1161 domain-containing protein n=1 Tax=Salinicola sp. JS01 TaxID=3050071 RepID=UPI00255BBF4D|nr:DUF1161 domain-containing protein [Salinicola sp. JS01]WIX34389.1 DUF1161 domain-containing protein [Salinicola sp. JS01]